ncbi:Crp/Fnr family transcriptional regulator [Pedobacter endophyticus]|uniref:Crp/Fnr family transcriptional regulator n=1 Tax=Pedobacter endophyticus TaxID=2789740 RepID=A0A7S9KY69_9SPHI|nr:Crp/Fnr family transcriptional regulator [Pedobacter endophyticus]QPH38995.1 Crp/Fnr family transcriptional regulator [Pedobacter endophyticus]
MLRTNLAFLSFIEKLHSEQPDSGILVKSFSPGTRFINQGDKIANVYIVKDGITKCFISEENGKDFIIEFLGKGEIAGELEAIKKIDCLCNVETISEVTVYAIPNRIFMSLTDTNPAFTQMLMQELATRIIQTSSRASFQQLYALEYGVLKLLKLQTEAQISIAKEDMAAYLGISLRSFNRTLKQLIDKKLTDFNGEEMN